MAESLKFGTSGLRGLAGELVGVEARRYVAAFVRHVRAHEAEPAILIGRDLRASSPAIARSVAEAITSFGLEAIDCGVLPTPALALENQRTARAAIMITGSHIPADRNGLKFYTDGEITKADEAQILALLDDAPAGSGKVTPDGTASRRYRERCIGLLPQGALAGMRVGVWQHSTVSRDLLVDVLKVLGAEVVALGRSDSFVPVDTEAVSTVVAEQVARWVQTESLDALVSADGDGDRPLVADERGQIVRGDVLGILTAQFVGADTVVTPVTSTSAVESCGAFRRVVRTKVGSPFVIAEMQTADDVVVGFEANGGVLLGSEVRFGNRTTEALWTRDAMLPILAVLGAARRDGVTVSALVEALPARQARSDRLEHVAADRSAALMDVLRIDARSFFAEHGPVESVSDVDGLRFVLSGGDVVHYRPSGNAPELRCYTEAATAGRAEALLSWGLAAAERIVR